MFSHIRQCLSLSLQQGMRLLLAALCGMTLASLTHAQTEVHHSVL